MSLSSLTRARIKRIEIELESGRKIALEPSPENHAYVSKFVNHGWMREGMGKYMGGEYYETVVHWVEPFNPPPPPPPQPKPEQLLDGEDYIHVTDAEAE